MKLDKEVTKRIEILVSKTKRELTAGLADELNQPLQAITGYAQEIEATGETNPAMLRELVSNAKRAAQVISCMRAVVTDPSHIGSVSEMTGRGYEYLVDAQGYVLAKFCNGQMISTVLPVGNTEVTAA